MCTLNEGALQELRAMLKKVIGSYTEEVLASTLKTSRCRDPRDVKCRATNRDEIFQASEKISETVHRDAHEHPTDPWSNQYFLNRIP